MISRNGLSVPIWDVLNAGHLGELMRRRDHGEALGVIISVRPQAALIGECIAGVFAAYHQAGCTASLWIVVLVDSHDRKNAIVARTAVGAFGAVRQVGSTPRGEPYGIGKRLVTDHFSDKPTCAIACLSAGAENAMHVSATAKPSAPSARVGSRDAGFSWRCAS